MAVAACRCAAVAPALARPGTWRKLSGMHTNVGKANQKQKHGSKDALSRSKSTEVLDIERLAKKLSGMHPCMPCLRSGPGTCMHVHPACHTYTHAHWCGWHAAVAFHQSLIAD
eukprot:1137043-Pelagomonas_calceolata.AAC.10